MKKIKYLIIEWVLPIILGFIYIEIMELFGDLQVFSFYAGAGLVFVYIFYDKILKHFISERKK